MTGKTRLDGFDGEWEEVKLEDVCNDNGMVRGPFGGSLKKEYFVNKGYKVYEQRNAIYKSVDIGNYYIDFNKFKELKRFKLKENDFIISCSGTIGEIYQIPKKFKKGIINQALLKISINTNLCDLTFFKNYFSWEKFKSKIIDDTQGGAMKNLVGMDKFRKTILYIPTDIKEQRAIASILTSMDHEIENLENEKAKIEKIKAGAMDDLLTGRVRLV
ncbi:restriction endonuclease subunit S [Finegoldia magna]|nr:restriction endonuclease subunit S [Finegoldia magna]